MTLPFDICRFFFWFFFTMVNSKSTLFQDKIIHTHKVITNRDMGTKYSDLCTGQVEFYLKIPLPTCQQSQKRLLTSSAQWRHTPLTLRHHNQPWSHLRHLPDLLQWNDLHKWFFFLPVVFIWKTSSTVVDISPIPFVFNAMCLQTREKQDQTKDKSRFPTQFSLLCDYVGNRHTRWTLQLIRLHTAIKSGLAMAHVNWKEKKKSYKEYFISSCEK